jgi:MATE family multidrug resistance protein
MRAEVKHTIQLATPIVVTQLAGISMGFIDTIMVSRGLGPGPLAAVALGNAVFFASMVFGMGIMNAVTPMASQAYGANDSMGVGRAFRQGLWLGLLIGIPIFLVIRAAPDLLLLMGQDPDTVVLARGYIRAISWGVFPFLWFIATRCFIESVSRPRPATVIALLGVGINVVANYVLMFGKAGFPALGIRGTGVASAVVFWCNFLILLAFCLSDTRLRSLASLAHIRRPDFRYLRSLARLGVPIGVSQGVEAGLFMLTAMIMGLISTTALAAHQMAIQFAAFTFMVPLGVGLAASVRVGQAVGRGDLSGARRAGHAGMLLAVSFMSCTALLIWLFPRLIISIFLDVSLAKHAEVTSVAVSLLGIAAVFQIVDGVQVSAMGALRGLKDTFVPMMISVLSYWGLGLGVGYYLAFPAGWGPEGLWWGLVTGLGSAAILLTWRFQLVSRNPPAAQQM